MLDYFLDMNIFLVICGNAFGVIFTFLTALHVYVQLLENELFKR